MTTAYPDFHVEYLVNLLTRADQVYFYGGDITAITDRDDAPVSDQRYDELKAELKAAAPDHPFLKRVGAPIPADSTLKKVRHVHPMGSLDNAYNIDDANAWIDKMLKDWPVEDRENFVIHASLKADGCSAAAIYKNGKFVQGITRGDDGVIGEDITANMARMRGLPHFVQRHGKPFNGSVRGEIVLTTANWKKLNPDQTSNPRNLGNGIARRKDGSESEFLTFVAFRLFDENGQPIDDLQNEDNTRFKFPTESGMIITLNRMGFLPMPEFSFYKSGDTSPAPLMDAKEFVAKAYTWMQEPKLDEENWFLLMFHELAKDLNYSADFPRRDGLPFEIDGLVLKVNSLLFQDKLGDSSNRPRAQIALKFPARGAKTTLNDVEFTVGHTGAIIPTGVLEPVKIGGVTVSRALLCNWDEIKRLDIAIRDTVLVTRRGDVIPKIEDVYERPKDRKPIPVPLNCPTCSGEVGKKTGVKGGEGVIHFCLNPDCPSKGLGKIHRWVSSLDIKGLGDVYIDRLWGAWQDAEIGDGPSKRRLLKSIADLYRWQQDPDAMAALNAHIGEKLVRKILAEINAKRELTLPQFLGSLGIEGLGKRRVQQIIEAAGGELSQLASWLIPGCLTERAEKIGLPGIAARLEAAVHDNLNLIMDLVQGGVELVYEDVGQTIAENAKTFCITGSLSKGKQHYADILKGMGHVYTDGYRKGLDFLVAADPGSGSSKLKKAAKDGVRVISEEQLVDFINGKLE